MYVMNFRSQQRHRHDDLRSYGPLIISPLMLCTVSHCRLLRAALIALHILGAFSKLLLELSSSFAMSCLSVHLPGRDRLLRDGLSRSWAKVMGSSY